MDSNWFYSSLAQSVAAIIGILSAFNINLIFNLMRNHNEIKSKLYDYSKLSGKTLNEFRRNIIYIRNMLEVKRNKAIYNLERNNISINQITYKQLIEKDVILKYDLDASDQLRVTEKMLPPRILYEYANKIEEFKNKMSEMNHDEIELNKSIFDLNSKLTLIKVITLINIFLFFIGVVTPLSFLASDNNLIFNIPVKVILLIAVSIIFLGFSIYLLFVVHSINPLNNTSAQKYSDDENIKKLIWEEK